MDGFPMVTVRDPRRWFLGAMARGLAVLPLLPVPACSRSPIQNAESLARSLGGRVFFDKGRLYRVELQRGRVRDGDLAQFAAWLPELEEIDLTGTKVTDAGIEAIAGLTKLRKLQLSGTKITSAAIAHLTRLTALTDVYLINTAIDDTAIEGLARLTGLRKLSVSGTKLTADGLERLRQALPMTTIIAEMVDPRGRPVVPNAKT